jgi:RHS repeat-associated protein
VRHYDPTAFSLPVKLVSPWGNESSVEYDAYRLLPVSSRASATAPLDQITAQVVNDYRLLGPVQITDANGNRSRASFDALGRVTATWVQGKDGEGDPDPLPGAEFSYHTSTLPTWTESRLRERHGDAAGPWQQARAYSDGSGRVVLTKQQAEPGAGNQPRWVGSGRTVFDNKGLPVKQYEPYFSATDGYEDEPDLVQQGVTEVLHYDPVGRLVRTDYPDGTFSRVEIGAWASESWDANDTVLDSLWYAERGAPDPAGEPEPADPDRRAAWLAAKHAGTPEVARMDSFGRVVRKIADTGPQGELETVTELDLEGNVLSVTDPRGIVVQSSLYDLAGRAVVAHSPDAGDRWTLPDIAGTPIRVWDSRGHMHEYQFDALRRPWRTWVTLPSAQRELVHAIWYGEGHPAAAPRNLLERPVITVDGSGLTHSVEYDFKGNLLVARHRLASEYQQVPDWAAVATAAADAVEADATALGLLDSELHQTSTQFDALNREISNVLPDGTIVTPAYNEGGVLESVKVNPIGTGQDEFYVRELDYDAKGQRDLIVYGNFLRTRYHYDPLTYRLARLETFRSGAPDDLLQDLRYTYDAVGNLTEIRDQAQQTHFYAGQVVSPSTRYEYDPLYRLSAATGREHDSLGAQPDHAEPSFGKPIPHPNDATKLRRYRQTYSYDAAGNLTRMQHVASGNPAASWTRDYTYAADSNRLLSHTRPAGGAAALGYDAHGNMTAMPHLPGPLTWDHADQLAAVQLLGGGTGHYAYDSTGERSRKVLHRAGGLVEERIYLGDYEIHRRTLNGTEVFRRTTVHVTDDTRRIALIEHKTVDGAPAAEVRVRYQLDNHLGSCSLEVDGSPAALLVSYEEYHPYGSTSLWLGANDVEASERRYRYTGKEKDEETGLYYHGARYYAPWLGRWTAADPAGLVDGTCVYAYCGGNPVMLRDPSGTQDAPPPGMITNDPRIGKLWEQAVVEELGSRYKTKTYQETVSAFQKDVAQKVADKGTGSNRQKGTGIHLARTTYARVRTRFGKLAKAQGISLKGIQVHHTFAELAKVPKEALTTTNLSFQRGNAGTEGSGHHFAGEVKKAHEAGVKNPGPQVRADLEAKGIKPDVPELGPSHTPNTAQPHTPKKPAAPKTPKGKKGGGTVGAVIAVGIGLFIFVQTGDAEAAVQTANPAANTTDELALKEGKATPGGTAEAVAKDLYGLTPVATINFVIREGLGPKGMVAQYFEETYGPTIWDQELADRAQREGRNGFCAQCHGPGGALDPNNKWNQEKARQRFMFPETTDADRQRMFELLQSMPK